MTLAAIVGMLMSLLFYVLTSAGSPTTCRE